MYSNLLYFFLFLADKNYMEKDKALNMRISNQFYDLLQRLSDQLGGKPKSQIVEEAVRVFATTARSEISNKDAIEELTKRLDALAENGATLKSSIDELRTLITQVLKNQQKS
jgi:predicted DNA-binding protein